MQHAYRGVWSLAPAGLRSLDWHALTGEKNKHGSLLLGGLCLLFAAKANVKQPRLDDVTNTPTYRKQPGVLPCVMRQGSYLSSFVQFTAQIFFSLCSNFCTMTVLYLQCAAFLLTMFSKLFLQISLSGGRAFKIPSSLAMLCILTLDLVSDCPK